MNVELARRLALRVALWHWQELSVRIVSSTSIRTLAEGGTSCTGTSTHTCIATASGSVNATGPLHYGRVLSSPGGLCRIWYSLALPAVLVVLAQLLGWVAPLSGNVKSYGDTANCTYWQATIASHSHPGWVFEKFDDCSKISESTKDKEAVNPRQSLLWFRLHSLGGGSQSSSKAPIL